MYIKVSNTIIFFSFTQDNIYKYTYDMTHLKLDKHDIHKSIYYK